jgi:hypothetical protein
MDYLVDIDGTVADCQHRMPFIKSKPKNYNAFYKACSLDTPMRAMTALVASLDAAGHRIVFCTGRPEKTRQDTVLWLIGHVFSGMRAPEQIVLYMREDADYRQDTLVKAELLDRIIADGYNPAMAFDDRPRVCDMWKERGILVARIGDMEHF